MKKKSMMVILMGLMMFTSCSLSTVNENQGKSVAVVAENQAAQETVIDAQAVEEAKVTTDVQDIEKAESNNDVQTAVDVQAADDAQTSKDSQITGSEEVSTAAQTIYTSHGVYTAYQADDYSFAEDGLSGTFHIASYDSYSKEYVDSLKEGDTIPKGCQYWDEDGKVFYEDIVIETLERDAAIDRVIINDCFSFVAQENGEYYLEDGAGFKNIIDEGKKTLKIAADVKIVENADSFNKDGIKENYSGTNYFKNVAELVDRLDDEDVWYQPNLYLRVENEEVKVIVVNPDNHEPWYGETEALFED